MFEGVSGNSRRMSIRDLRIIRKVLLPEREKTHGHGYYPDLELSDRSQERLEMKTHG